MESAQSFYLKRKEMFRQNISSIKENTVNEYINSLMQHIYSELDQMLGDNGIYRKQLSSQQSAILNRALSLIQVQQDFWEASVNQLSFKPNEKQKGEKEETGQSLKSPEVPLGLALTGSVISGLLSMGIVWQLCIPIAAFIGGKLINTKFDKDELTKADNNGKYTLSDKGCEVIINIIEKLYSNIDYFLKSYETQAENIRNEYDSKNKPFEIRYRSLLEKASNLIGTIKYSNKNIDADIAMEAKILEKELNNMNFRFIHYPNTIGGKTQEELFDFIYSSNTKDTASVYPAVVKDDSIIVKGRVDKPAK